MKPQLFIIQIMVYKISVEKNWFKNQYIFNMVPKHHHHTQIVDRMLERVSVVQVAAVFLVHVVQTLTPSSSAA